MSPAKQFTEVIHAWSTVFMHRSVSDFRRFIGKTGMSFTQINVLMRRFYHGRCGVSEIGSQMGVSNAAASQIVNRLVQAGFLDRREDPEDRRAKLLSLSPIGRSMIEQGIAARGQWLEDLAASLDPAEREMITEALTLLTRAARKREAEAAVQKSHKESR